MASAMLSLGCGTGGDSLKRVEYRQVHMGTEARIVLYAPDSATAERAARAAFSRVAELDSALSDYRFDSELMRLREGAGGPPVKVSDDLIAVLARAQSIAIETNGAFDITVGPYVVLWREARRSRTLPAPPALVDASTRVGFRLIEIDTLTRSVRLARAGMRLDLGGIAKGYAVDQAFDILRVHGLPRALVSLGGEIHVGDPPPGEEGWGIGIVNVRGIRRALPVKTAAVSSSGDSEQFVEIGGRRYSHVVDPRSGMALVNGATATVIAPDAMSADAFATAVTVLEGEARAAFIAAHPEATFYVRERGK